MWKTIEADGVTWEVSAVQNPDLGIDAGQEMLEFRCRGGDRPPRRIVVDRGALEGMDRKRLQSVYTQARPIGGDHYGRPGKRMSDG
jgi:hypothetical protein